MNDRKHPVGSQNIEIDVARAWSQEDTQIVKNLIFDNVSEVKSKHAGSQNMLCIDYGEKPAANSAAAPAQLEDQEPDQDTEPEKATEKGKREREREREQRINYV